VSQIHPPSAQAPGGKASSTQTVSEAGSDEGGGEVEGTQGVTVSVAVFVTPPLDAVIVTGVEEATFAVATEKVVEVEPAGTVTFAGTVAAAVFALVRATVAPPGGALPVMITVPVEELPPATLAGLTERVERAAGLTVRLAVFDTPEKAAVIVTGLADATPSVVTVKGADAAPAGTVTLAGTVADDVLELDSVTAAPPAGAAPVRVAVPVEGLPPTTVTGLRVREERARTPAVTVKFAV
jgi:hypothetical protein